MQKNLVKHLIMRGKHSRLVFLWEAGAGRDVITETQSPSVLVSLCHFPRLADLIWRLAVYMQ